MTETQTVDLAAWLTRIWDEEERHALSDLSQPEPPYLLVARIAADRKILELHRPERPPWSTMQAPGCRTCGTAQAWDDKAQQANCETLRLLASPYADREGFQDAWAV